MTVILVDPRRPSLVPVEAIGLLALMLLQESRRDARTSSTGDIILLEDQDRSLWNQAQIQEGKSQLMRALAMAPLMK